MRIVQDAEREGSVQDKIGEGYGIKMIRNARRGEPNGTDSNA